jgi:hypothetical protein
MLIIGVAVVSVGLMVADYFWLRHQAKQKHEQRYHRGDENERSGFRRAAHRAESGHEP